MRQDQSLYFMWSKMLTQSSLQKQFSAESKALILILNFFLVHTKNAFPRSEIASLHFASYTDSDFQWKKDLMGCWVVYLKFWSSSFIQERWEEHDAEYASRSVSESSDGGKTRPKRFVPYSHGPRDCAGQSLARMSYTATIAMLFAHFSFKLASEVTLFLEPNGSPMTILVWKYSMGPQQAVFLVI